MSSDLKVIPSTSAAEVRRFPFGRFELFEVAGQTLGRAIYSPGWRWSEHVGPQSGTQWCEVAHLGYVVAGRAAIRMRDGAGAIITTGDWFAVPPGHDSWVVGDDDYESVHLLGAGSYAAPDAAPPSASDGQQQWPSPLSSRTLPTQSWGEGCQGWTLLDTPALHVMEETMPPGTQEHPHWHSRVEQLYYMVDGTAVTHLRGARVDLVPGTAIAIPAGSEHQLVNHGDTSNRFLVISSGPPRADRADATPLRG